MLRRRQDNTFEFRDIERALYSIQPPALTPGRKDALRSRIMTSLGEQEALRQAGILTPVFRERWVAVPAGVGLAVAIIAGIKAYEAYGPITGTGDDQATFAGQLSLDGAPVTELRPGPTFVAASETNVHLGHEVVLMLKAGASFSYAVSGRDVTVYTREGVSTVVTGEKPANVAGNGWNARLGVASAVQFSVFANVVTVSATDGLVRVTEVGGASHALAAGGTVTFRIGEGAPPEITPPADPLNSNGSSGGNGQATGAGPSADDAEDDDATASPGNSANKPGAAVVPPNPAPPVPAGPSKPVPPVTSEPEEASEAPESSSPEDLPPAPPSEPQGPPEEVPAPIVPPGHGGETPVDPPGGGQPEDPGNGNGNGEPPVEPPGGGQPEEPGSNGNGNGPDANNGNGNGPDSNNGNGNGSENGTGPGSSNGQGNGNGNGNQAMTLGEENPAPPFASDPDEGETDSVDSGHNGNGYANGHAHAPGQQDNQGGSGANNGNAGNPGQGKGPAKKP